MSLFVAASGTLGLALFLIGVTAPRRDRLSSRVEPYLNGLHGKPSGLLRQVRVARYPFGVLERSIKRWLPYRYEDVRRRLASAGDSRSPEEFRFEQLLWGLAGAVSVLTLFALTAFAAGGADPRGAALLTLFSGVSGFLARDWWLGRQVENRRQAIAAELPIALDLIALAVMAGESVPAAFERISQRLSDGIGSELQAVVGDIRAGSSVIEAIEALAARVPDPGVARFVDAICTGIERGAPLAEVLRGQADDARDGRRRQLLEQGGKREVVMLVPVVFLIMPVVVVFALYPGLVSLDLLVP